MKDCEDECKCIGSPVDNGGKCEWCGCMESPKNIDSNNIGLTMQLATERSGSPTTDPATTECGCIVDAVNRYISFDRCKIHFDKFANFWKIRQQYDTSMCNCVLVSRIPSHLPQSQTFFHFFKCDLHDMLCDSNSTEPAFGKFSFNYNADPFGIPLSALQSNPNDRDFNPLDAQLNGKSSSCNANKKYQIPPASSRDDLSTGNKMLHEMVAQLTNRIAELTAMFERRLSEQQALIERLTMSSQTPNYTVMEVEVQQRNKRHHNDSDSTGPVHKKAPAKSFQRPNAHTIVNKQFVHAGRKGSTIATIATPPPKQSVAPLPKDALSSSIADASDSENANTSDENEPPTARNTKRTAKNKNKKNDHNLQKETTKQKSTNKPISDNNKNNATNDESNTNEEAKRRKFFKKPSPITADIKQAHQLRTILKDVEGRYSVRCVREGVRIYPTDYEVHPLICQTLYDNEIGQYTHDLHPFKKFRAVLSGMDVFSTEELTVMIQEAVGVTPICITSTNSKYNPIYFVDFKADETNLKSLSEIRTIGYYHVQWRAYINKRSGPTQCTTCAAFGHGQKNCSRVTVCLLCADAHSMYDCQLYQSKDDKISSQLHRCINCERASLDAKHPANSPTCPCRARHIANCARTRTKSNANQQNALTIETTERSRKMQSTPNQTNRTRTPSRRRSTSVPKKSAISYADAVSQNQNKIKPWSDICGLMERAYEQIMSAKTEQEQMMHCFKLFGAQKCQN